MAKIKYSALNFGIWRLWDFDSYASEITENQVEYTFGATAEAAFGTYDPRDEPYRAVFLFEDAVFTSPTLEAATSGRITGFTLYDEADNILVTGTELDGDLADFLSLMSAGDGRAAMQALYTRGIAISGSATNGRDPGDWQGEVIQTGVFRDRVNAKDGDDIIFDYGGRDRYNGGDGFDTVSYQHYLDNPDLAERGINARLTSGTIMGPDGQLDEAYGIESVLGTMAEDRFSVAGNQTYYFVGYGGRDRFSGGWGKNDWVSYSEEAAAGGSSGINVKLDRNTIADSFGDRDYIRFVENIVGTDFDDRFRDDDSGIFHANFIGNAGNDRFSFQGGNDRAEGGTGADTFVYLGTDFDHDVIADFETGIDRIQIKSAAAFSELTITDSGADKVITWGDNSVTLEGLAGTEIAEADFIF
ncbi:MAG: hypothetical protein R3D59_00465 [Paracoccaceae bacterium]